MRLELGVIRWHVRKDYRSPISDVKELAQSIVEQFEPWNYHARWQTIPIHHWIANTNLALIWHNYIDAVKEGDGDHILSLWKFLLVIKKKTGHKNYSKEAFLSLINYHFLFFWVVCPLTSLIMDQKNKFVPRGIVAIAVVLGGQIN